MGVALIEVDEPQHFGHLRAGPHDVGEQLLLGQVAAQRAELGAQVLFGRLQPIDPGRVLHRQRDAVRQELQQHQVVVAEARAPARIDHFERAQALLAHHQRGGQQRAGAQPRVPVDQRIEVCLRADIIDLERPPTAQRFPGDALGGGELEPGQAARHLGVELGEVGEVQLAAAGGDHLYEHRQ